MIALNITFFSKFLNIFQISQKLLNISKNIAIFVSRLISLMFLVMLLLNKIFMVSKVFNFSSQLESLKKRVLHDNGHLKLIVLIGSILTLYCFLLQIRKGRHRGSSYGQSKRENNQFGKQSRQDSATLCLCGRTRPCNCGTA